MNMILKNACRYVKNTNGGATTSHFVEDHEPVGRQIWLDLTNQGLVRQDENGRIFLTEAGAKLLDA